MTNAGAGGNPTRREWLGTEDKAARPIDRSRIGEVLCVAVAAIEVAEQRLHRYVKTREGETDKG